MAPEAKRITDKLPGNFFRVGLIHLALPKARIIHTRRDLRDTALSCFSILWPNGREQTYDLAELGRYCRAYQALMDHWRSVLPEGVMLEVQYEDVVDNLEEGARRIVAHCGLEWDNACLAFHRTERSVRAESASQVRQPNPHKLGRTVACARNPITAIAAGAGGSTITYRCHTGAHPSEDARDFMTASPYIVGREQRLSAKVMKPVQSGAQVA